MSKTFVAAGLMSAALLAGGVQAATDISMWHAMTGSLGDWVQDLANDFNKSQQNCRLTPTYKGSYDQTMTSGIAAHRAGRSPNILQVFEVGTATMMFSKGAVVPVGDLMAKAGYEFHADEYIPAVYGYYSTPDGRMMSYPFNSSTTVMYVNLTKFKKAGLPTETDKLPKTWDDVKAAAKALKDAGEACPMTTSWMGWTQLETFSTWHNVEFASLNNGFGGPAARLKIDSPLHRRHIENLAEMAKNGLFVYKGRGNQADAAFYTGECGISMGSSATLANIRRNADFEFMTLPMPYYPDVEGAPQNTALGGASLWAMAGKSEAENKCVADFFHYLSDPQVQANNHMRTGYLPVTLKAFEIAKASGYYEKNPGADVPVKQMLKTTEKSRGIRLGYLPNIRTIVDEEFEKIWTGGQSAADALAAVVRRGNEQLARFERVTNR
ncbi:sn-glycerol-3-phosphate ABC transporter substrate-binding protein UgpB [Sutterella megalosphaeroides]|uniref:sn-glycerol-3-phosphate-binding periplasmic protein UgpB n=1 Tax=Sutterella megalosphaeroides TaxID=2494234 RepID=A0A2Z6ICB6_9BURK|nr:sn-glycerol-3-phosphate ABC transporter substrate-binding protein UgpB [Sutterella megalosphaeroides]BBF22708.1 ABC transporter substrate-binding protein [Sutterella megalosphaeroides]